MASSRHNRPAMLLVLAAFVCIVGSGARAQPLDPRIVLGAPALDANGNKVHDELEVKIATGTLMAPEGGAVDGALALPTIRKPYGDLIVCLDHAPIQADIQRMQQLGAQVDETWSAAIFGMRVRMPRGLVNAGGVLAIGAEPQVTWVEENAVSRATLYFSTQQTRARNCWTRSTAVDGHSGIRLAVLDSGIDGTQFGSAHTDFTGKIHAWQDYAGTAWANAGDRYGHGSHCGGIMAGTGAAGGISTGHGLLYRSAQLFFHNSEWYYWVINSQCMPVDTTGISGQNEQAQIRWDTGWGGPSVYEVLQDDSGSGYLNYNSGSISGSQPISTTYTLGSNITSFTYYAYATLNGGGGNAVWYVQQTGSRMVAVGDDYNLNCGMAPQCELVGLKVLGDTGSGTSTMLINALNWLVSNASANNIVTANMSLGFTSIVSSVDTAVNSAVEAGCL